MLKQRGEKTADGKWSIPAAERNKGPILDVLARVLPERGVVLEVASGTGLADAMRNQPHVFDELTIQMTEVGENSGTLDGVLDQLADFKDRSLQFKRQRSGATHIPPPIFRPETPVLRRLKPRSENARERASDRRELTCPAPAEAGAEYRLRRKRGVQRPC